MFFSLFSTLRFEKDPHKLLKGSFYSFEILFVGVTREKLLMISNWPLFCCIISLIEWNMFELLSIMRLLWFVFFFLCVFLCVFFCVFFFVCFFLCFEFFSDLIFFFLSPLFFFSLFFLLVGRIKTKERESINI